MFHSVCRGAVAITIISLAIGQGPKAEAICQNPPCHPIEGENQEPPITGAAFPKYMVLTVLYAPPGTSGGPVGGNTGSSVTYSSASSTGSVVSTGSSFKAGTSVTVEAEGGIFGGGGVSTNFSASEATGDRESIEIRKTAGREIQLPATSQSDGIDHGRDIIYLWLNPKLDFSISGDAVTWTPDVKSPPASMDIQWVQVSELKDPSTMRANVASLLASHGIRPADYGDILRADPFANGSAVIDRTRFIETAYTLPYEQPVTQGDVIPSSTYSVTNETNDSRTHSSEWEESVGVTLSGSAGFPGVFTLKMQVSDKFTWTHSSAHTNSEGDKQGATVAMGGPSFGYTGPTDLVVYWDTVFDSFMFAFLSNSSPTGRGVVLSEANKPVANCLVILDIDGKTFRTFTDSKGRYRFLNTPTGKGRITVLNQSKSARLGMSSPSLQFRIGKGGLEMNRNRAL